MIINYFIDLKDYVTYQLFMASTSARIKRKRQNSKVVWPILYIILGVLFSLNGNLSGIIIFSIIAILWYFIYPAWEKGHYYRHYNDFIKENYKEILGKPTSLEINNDFIISKDDSSESKIQTKEVEEIFEIPDAIYIKLKSGQSFILPTNKIKDIELIKRRLYDLAAYLNINYSVNEKWVWN